MGGSIPTGYKVENKKLIVAPERAELVRRVFSRFIEIQSPKQIAHELNQEGIRTNQDREWTTAHIYRMLNNRTYIGKVFYKNEEYEGKQERIISDEMWQRVQALKKPGKEVSGYLDRLTPLWDEMFPAERNRVMHLLLQKVTLYEDRLELEIRTAGMKQFLEELDYERKN